MRPTLLLRATEYRPMIQFIGQRKNIQHAPHAPAPHPCAPQEIAETFQSFLAKLQSQGGSADSPPSKPKGQSLEDSAKGQPTPSGQYQTSSSSNSRSNSTPSSGGSSGSSGKPADFENFWEAPSYLWTPKPLTDREVEAVMVCPASPAARCPMSTRNELTTAQSGGATDIRTGP